MSRRFARHPDLLQVFNREVSARGLVAAKLLCTQKREQIATGYLAFFISNPGTEADFVTTGGTWNIWKRRMLTLS